MSDNSDNELENPAIKSEGNENRKLSIMRSSLLKQPSILTITDNMNETLRYFQDRFDDFCSVTEFHKLSTRAQVATLKGFFNKDIWKIFNTFTEAQKADVPSISNALEAHF